MKGSNRGIHALRRLPQALAVFSLIISGPALPVPASGQKPYQTQAGEMMLFESAGAARVVEKVRSKTQGVIVEVFVKTGDPVMKGQILGHAELESAKLQLDLARQNMESKANLEAARCQAEAFTITRGETELAVRKRKAEESRLEWALAMEKMYQARYDALLEAKKIQTIQHAHAKQQYENRFFRAPVDGIVSQVLVEPGKTVNHAFHAFTISNENTYLLPVAMPAQLAVKAIPNETLPVRSADGKSVSHARIDSVMDDPSSAGRKIVRLLIRAADLPAATRANLMGMKFDVLLPGTSRRTRH